MPHVTPRPIRATNVADPTAVHAFDSISAAQAQVEKWVGKRPHHSTVTRAAQNKAVAFGQRWEFITFVEQNPVQPTAEPMDVPDTSLFTFRDCVEGIFNGGKVRVTDEVPRRASVIDVIRIVLGEHTNPGVVWQRMNDDATHAEVITFCYNFKFPGAGQRDTPVTDSAGIMLLVNALPGVRARRFRTSAMAVLVRFLAGDTSLHEEIDENARRQLVLPPQHPMQMLSEDVYAHPRSSKYIMHSPSMAGKYIGYFYNRCVVYLLRFTYEGKSYVKIGWSDEFRGRMDSHFIELPGCTIYCVIAVDNAYRVEQSWKDDFRAYNATIVVDGKKKTELYTGVSETEAEARLQELCQEQRRKASDSHEIDMMERKMAHELAMKDKELALKAQEVELQRILLKTLEAQRMLK